MSITIMFVILMVVIVAISMMYLWTWINILLLEMANAVTFITLKCAILTKGTVVTTLEKLMGSAMTSTTTEFAIMMEETAALEKRTQLVVLNANVSMFLT